MNEKRKLDNQEIENVSGGFPGYNKYSREIYHKAGMNTSYGGIFAKDRFQLNKTETEVFHILLYETQANIYVDYYLSHTPEEYIKFVQIDFPEYYQIVYGHREV